MSHDGEKDFYIIGLRKYEENCLEIPKWKHVKSKSWYRNSAMCLACSRSLIWSWTPYMVIWAKPVVAMKAIENYWGSPGGWGEGNPLSKQQSETQPTANCWQLKSQEDQGLEDSWKPAQPCPNKLNHMVTCKSTFEYPFYCLFICSITPREQ